MSRDKLESTRDRILSKLKLGKQAPGYKAAVKALGMMIEEMSNEQNPIT